MKRVCCFLCVMLLLAGCGLGDSMTELINGYELLDDGVCTIHKKNMPGGSVSDLDVMAYCIIEEYVLIRGVQLAGSEQISGTQGYYIINTLTDTVYGMYETPLQLQYQCEELGVFVEQEWIAV